MLAAGSPGEKYNFGGDSERTNVEVVDAICDALDALRPRGPGHYRSLKRFVPDRPGHDLRYAIDASRAKTQLGWTPSRTFADGLAETVKWYLDNRQWCETVQAGKDARARLGLASAALDANGAVRT